MKDLAALMALRVASVPEFTNLILSTDSTRSHISSPHSTTSGAGAGYETPRANCSSSAETTAG